MLPGGAFAFDLRDARRLGPRSYADCFISLAVDMAADSVLALDEPVAFLRDLEKLARNHAPSTLIDKVGAAARIIAERSRHQLRNVLDGGTTYALDRTFILEASPATKRHGGNRDDGLDYVDGVPTPRAELLWHSLCSEWCDVRTRQHAQAAWLGWARDGRPGHS